MHFLPAYSPELNPDERVIAHANFGRTSSGATSVAHTVNHLCEWNLMTT